MSFDRMVCIAKNVYIKVYGVKKWNSLTDQQKHDAVMFIWQDFGKALDARK